jgi:lipoprotein-releasing system permease protein
MRSILVDEVIGVTVQLNQNIFIRNGVSRISANLSGIETLNEDRLFNTSKYMVEGDLLDLDKYSNGIILGTGLALRIGVSNGDHVAVITSEGISKVFKVIGLIETGANTVDRTRAIVSIQTARQLFSKNKSYATEVMVNIQDYSDAKGSRIRNKKAYPL